MEFKQDGTGFAESAAESVSASTDYTKHEASVAAFYATPAKPFPKVGDTLQVRHQVKRTSAGDCLGVMRGDGKPVSVRITAVYMDGSVRVGNSEVWEVKPGTKNTWETINPDRAERS